MPTQLPIRFVTNRAPLIAGEPGFGPDADPAAPTRLRFGSARMRGLGHTDTETQRKLVAGSLVVDAVDEDAAAVRAYLKAWLDEAEKDRAVPLLFVHGFQVMFDFALNRAAQITEFYAAGERPVRLSPLVFSWPSDGDFGIEPYKADRRDAEAAGPAFARFLAFLTPLVRGLAPAKRPVLLGHSMGCFVVRHGVRTYKASGHGAGATLFRDAILAAADDDATMLDEGQPLRILAELADRVSVLCYAVDGVLTILSDWIAGNPPRLGAGGPGAGKLASNVDVVDVVYGINLNDSVPSSDATMNKIAHQYYRNNLRVREDMAQILAGTPSNEIGRRRKYTPAEAKAVGGGTKPDRYYLMTN